MSTCEKMYSGVIRCDVSGGMLDLYGRLYGVNTSEANRQIREALWKMENIGRIISWQKQKEIEPEIILAELADAETIDRTYSGMLSAYDFK